VSSAGSLLIFEAARRGGSVSTAKSLKAKSLKNHTKKEEWGKCEATTDDLGEERDTLYTSQTTVKYEKGLPRTSRNNVSYEQTGRTGSTGLER
jgi:hypothetical protein